MLIEIILALLLGCTIGTFTGLIPGIHINLVCVFLVAFSVSVFSSVNPIHLVVFITAMAIAHTFIDFIPSVFLGCPDTDTELSVLPGHELLKQGNGYQAVILTCYGSLAAIFTLIVTAFPFMLLAEKIYSVLKTPYIMTTTLIITSIFLVSLEKKKFSALFVFLISGFLGLCVLNLKSINQPLLPMLTGLFGSSMLLQSIKNKIKIPKQKIINPRTEIQKPIASAFLGSLIASPLCSFLPGLGSGQAAVIGNIISRTNKKGFLVLLGATNTLVMGFSFISLYVVSKTRTGSAIAIQEIVGKLSWQILILILAVILISGIISFFITMFLAKFFSQKIAKINYTTISTITLIFLAIIIFMVSGFLPSNENSIISGFLGLIILIASTFTGIYCINLRVRRTQMMGCLLIPTIFFYLFL